MTLYCVCVCVCLICSHSQGLESWAGEVLGAEAGQDFHRYDRTQRHHFDLEPERDEARVVQVFPVQRRGFRLAEELLDVGHHRAQVLREDEVDGFEKQFKIKV